MLFAAQLHKEHNNLISPWQRCKHRLSTWMSRTRVRHNYQKYTFLHPSQHFFVRYLSLSSCETWKGFSAKFWNVAFSFKSSFLIVLRGYKRGTVLLHVFIEKIHTEFLLNSLLTANCRNWSKTEMLVFAERQEQAGWYNSPQIHNRVENCDYIANYTTNILI